MNGNADPLPHDMSGILADLGPCPERIVSDSRRVTAGTVFAAYPGATADGRRFIPQAIARGASGVLWEEHGFHWDPQWRAPNQPVAGLRLRLGEIASHIYGRPSERLWMTGVTGTNGKTSVTHWIAQAMTRLGRGTALLGTVGHGFPGDLAPSLNTTPDAADLQANLAEFAAMGAHGCAMEVSSHGLDQGRVNGCRFDVAVLTNLTRDHLDYHGDMESYAAAKARLFAWPGLAFAVVNRDDTFGQQLRPRATTLGYGFDAGELRATRLEESRTGMHLDLTGDWGHARIEAPLLGRFNAYNLLAALGALIAADISMASACEALGQVTPPPGRMQTFGGAGRPLVVIDYAHTPDALENVLATLRPLARDGRLLCVFGCGGDRDPGKRPLMGRAASVADLSFVTSDNPRGEAPLAIIEDILPGMSGEHRVEPDRARAIFEAVGLAGAHDVILIAGKGHENYQEIQGERRPFSDFETASRAMRAWGMEAAE